MKRKINALITAVLLGATMLSSCAGANYKVSFSPYWLKDVNGDQNGVSETLVYDVTFNKGTPRNNYELTYQTGTYTTTLTSKKENGELIYKYTTELSISGTYTYDENTFSFEDCVTSSVEFYSTNKSLAPIASHKEYCSHTPRNTDVTKETDFSTWKKFGTVDIDYTTNKAFFVSSPDTDKEYSRETRIDYGKDKYSRLDNEQLWLGLRGVLQAEHNAPRFAVYAPFTRKVQRVAATFEAKLTEKNLSFTLNGEAYAADVTYFPVSLVLDEKNSGSTQKLWIAATDNVQNNKLRNVILHYEALVPYGLGTLVYQLKSANFTA